MLINFMIESTIHLFICINLYIYVYIGEQSYTKVRFGSQLDLYSQIHICVCCFFSLLPGRHGCSVCNQGGAHCVL